MQNLQGNNRQRHNGEFQYNNQYSSTANQFQYFPTPQQQQYHSKIQPPTQQQTPKTSQYNSSYTTSITQLISQPMGQNIYSMEYVYQSIYQLSDYLWNKKIMTYYKGQGQNVENGNDSNSNAHLISFDEYLLPLQEQLTKYDKFKKLKNKEEEQIYSMLNSTIGQNMQINANSTPSVPNNFLMKQNLNSSILQTQLIKCYQQVPFIYFQDNFSLDFANFQDKKNRYKYNNTLKMKQAQQVMNDNLDLIEINLFGQIHRKFQDYFKVAANFDYLKQSITQQLIKLKQTRRRISKVQIQFVIKSQKLRKKIIQRTNYQKLIKKLKLLKSLRKLPSIIQTILQSSLPYQCLQLLKSTKKSINQLQQIKCVQSIITNIKKCQTIVQLGLNKRYTDSVYLYIEEVFQAFNFQEQFKKIDSPVVNQKDMNTSSAIHNLNLSRRSVVSSNANGGETSFRADQRSGFFVLEELGQGKGTSTFNGKPLLKNMFAKRLQQKQYQIAMIMLQSFQYIDFPIDVTKIKIMNGLRIICRKFQKDVINNFKKQLEKAQSTNANSVLNDLSFQEVTSILSGQQITPINRINSQTTHNAKQKHNSNQNSDSPQQNQQYINQVSIQFYIKHIKILNQLFKQCVNRYLGYITTLIVQYEERITKAITEIDKSVLLGQKSSNKSIDSNSQKDVLTPNRNSDDLTSSNVKSLQRSQKMSKMQLSYNKFKQILTQQLSLLPSIFKIIQQKIKHFLTLKNIGNASPQQFFQWVSLLRFWQRWFDVFIEQSPLVNYTYTYLTSNSQISSSTQLLSLGQDMMEELINVVVDNIKKSVTTMSLKNLITQLTINYLNSYAATVNSELYQALLEQSWQSVEIPQQFSQILNGILNKPSDNQNMSITILNSSTNGKTTNQSSFTSSSKKQNPLNSQKSLTMNNSALMSSSNFKYKILKNNILTDGQRYKLTVSFLLLCQFIEQFIRVGRLFQGITGQNDQQSSIKQSKNIKKIQSHLYDKIYEFIDHYNVSTKEMILQKKALKTQKIKGNNITVKHICLLSNCLSFLEKLTREIPLKELMIMINKNERQSETVYGLVNHNVLLVDKISSILYKKMQQVVASLKTKQQQKGITQQSILQFIIQTNQSIVTVFLQITQIVDQYLDVEKCQKILKAPFFVFVQKYFKVIIEKDEKVIQQARILLEKMKFLKKYFKNQFIAMQRQLD